LRSFICYWLSRERNMPGGPLKKPACGCIAPAACAFWAVPWVAVDGLVYSVISRAFTYLLCLSKNNIIGHREKNNVHCSASNKQDIDWCPCTARYLRRSACKHKVIKSLSPFLAGFFLAARNPLLSPYA